MPKDADGYPLELPYTVPGSGPVVMEAPLLLHNDGNFARGTYTLYWEGVGTIDFWGASIVPGSYVQGANGGSARVTVGPGSPGMFLRLLTSRRGNHVRNVRFVRPGFEGDYLAQPFNPEFLARVRPFYAIRYMPWMNANTNTNATWEGRTTPRSQTQARGAGASYEYIVQLSNLTNTRPWINVGFATDDNHVRRMAQLFYDSLNPELEIYVEYANEAWNFAPGFQTFGYLNAKYPGQFTRGYALEASRIWRIFREAFGADSLRVKRVLAGQHANPDIVNQIIGHLPDGP
ncbi:MAG: hypothetical protein MUC97_16380, partial [Bernardetiaceae bacterium]|nr:hypothetical protein [Bernardetiaceae bacterium]